MAICPRSPLRAPFIEAPPPNSAIVGEDTNDDILRGETPPAEGCNEETGIQDLSGDTLYHIFRHLTDADTPTAAQTLCTLQRVCKTWKAVVENILVRHYWLQCAQIPSLRWPVSKIDALCNPDTTWPSRFACLTLYLRDKGAPIPKGVTHLGFHSFPYLQAQQDGALVKVWKSIWKKIDFAEDHTAQDIRLWFDETNAGCPNPLIADPVKNLKVSNAALGILPPEIGELHQLRQLMLPLNKLGELPPEIGKLSRLRLLNLANNKLRGLPPEVGQLNALRWLELDGNDLREIPSEIGKLVQLKSLYLKNNQLREIPPQIGELRELQDLDFSNNRLCEIPSEIGNLSRLEHLNLNHNQINKLPPEIGALRGLYQLSLSGNRLRELPIEISKLSGLKILDLSKNRLVRFPSEISQLNDLSGLALHDNLLLFRVKKDLSEDIDIYALDINIVDTNDLDMKTIFDQNLACATYPCQTSLAKLCQGIHCGNGPEALQKHFEELSDEMQAKILKHISPDPSQSSSSAQPAGNYWADEVVFVKALIAALQETFQTLTMPEKQSIYEQVAFLAGEPAIVHLGKELAENNMIRFIEAMALVLEM